MTLGEYRVEIALNSTEPRDNDMAAELKRCAANFIDLIALIHNDMDVETEGEVERLKAIAMTHIEDAAMWAVKAATKGPR